MLVYSGQDGVSVSPIHFLQKRRKEKLKNLLCKPCCFGSKKDKKNNLIFKPEYVRNVLFCKGKINWAQYLTRVENDQRIENYISTNDDTNKYNTFIVSIKLSQDLPKV